MLINLIYILFWLYILIYSIQIIYRSVVSHVFHNEINYIFRTGFLKFKLEKKRILPSEFRFRHFHDSKKI